MTVLQQLKKVIYEHCNALIMNRIQTLESVLQSLAESRNNESKSSVGDKYETGRAMIQLEEEQNKTQLQEALAAKSILASIKLDMINNKVEVGSFVITDSGKYFIAIGIGKIIIENEVIFAISIDSPIGQVLKNKKAEEVINFNRNEMKILKIV